MDPLHIITALIISILGYFLKSTMDSLKETQKICTKNQSDIDVLRTEYAGKFENLTEKVNELKDTLRDLIKEIKILNSSINGKV